jgi:6,7-dimethyl-8-ribityllumazine synthase
MATNLRNLSDYTVEDIPNAEGFKFGIVVSEWHPEITNILLQGAKDTLLKHDVYEDDIIIKKVPGSFELSIGCQFMAEYTMVDVIICLGAVIRGETPHFEYICQGVTQGITTVGLDYNIPVIFGLLTTDNFDQAKERSGGKCGNKGVEAAITAIKMAVLQDEMIEEEEEYDDEEDI